MNQETKKILEWQVNNLLEYRNKLLQKGLMESVETIDCVLQTTQQFLDNPKKIEWILNN